MEIEIKPSEPIKVKFGDKAFEIRVPKVRAMQAFSKRMKEDEDGIAAMYDFCLHVGVPQDVLDQWDSHEMAQLFKQLNQDEKKS